MMLTMTGPVTQSLADQAASDAAHPFVLVVAKLPPEVRDRPGMGHPFTTAMYEWASEASAITDWAVDNPDCAGWARAAVILVPRWETVSDSELGDRIAVATERLQVALRDMDAPRCQNPEGCAGDAAYKIIFGSVGSEPLLYCANCEYALDVRANDAVVGCSHFGYLVSGYRVDRTGRSRRVRLPAAN